MGRASEASAAKILVSEGVGARFQVGGEQESRWSVMGKVCGGREVKSSQVRVLGLLAGSLLGRVGTVSGAVGGLCGWFGVGRVCDDFLWAMGKAGSRLGLKSS